MKNAASKRRRHFYILFIRILDEKYYFFRSGIMKMKTRELTSSR